MKAALFEGRTVAWHNDDLMGKTEHVEAVVKACLTIEAGFYPGKASVLPVTIRNACPVNFTLRNTSEETFQNVSDVFRVERGGATELSVRTGEVVKTVELTFEVLNTQVGYRKSLELVLSADAAPAPIAR